MRLLCVRVSFPQFADDVIGEHGISKGIHQEFEDFEVERDRGTRIDEIHSRKERQSLITQWTESRFTPKADELASAAEVTDS